MGYYYSPFRNGKKIRKQKGGEGKKRVERDKTHISTIRAAEKKANACVPRVTYTLYIVVCVCVSQLYIVPNII